MDYCVEFFYKVKQNNPMGEYVKASSKSASWITHVWKPESSVAKSKYNAGSLSANDTQGVALESVIEAIKRASPYYFRNKAVTRKTLQSFYGLANGYNGYGTPRKYIIDDGGIKRQYTTTYKCPEVCGYVQDDDNAKDCLQSDKEVRDHYVKAFDKITGQLANCTASAACKDSKTEENTFQISADNTAMKDATRKSSEYEGKNTTNSNNQCINPSGDIEMFVPLVTDLERVQEGATSYECNINPNGINGKCYGKDNPNYWQHYKTTITYPGTWINLKNGERLYRKEGLDLNTVRENKNYYCTGFDFDSVNEEWWNWKFNPIDCEGNSGIQEDMSTINSVTVKVDDNIKANIIKFGKYNWSFDLKCFYGLSKTVCLPPPGGEDPCDSENSTELCNLQFRPVTSSNLFPSSEGNGSREAGFNWTSKATDKTISTSVNQLTGYGIDPGVYAKEIQENAQANDEVNFSGIADYYIHLTRDNIKALRKYASDNGYTSFNLTKNSEKTPAGTYTQVNGIEELYYYSSSLLNDNKYINKLERNVQRGVNNN